VVRAAGEKSSMGVRKEDMAMESSVDQPYFSVSTEQRFLWKRKAGTFT